MRIDVGVANFGAPFADLMHRDRLGLERAAALHRSRGHRVVMVREAEDELRLHAAVLEVFESDGRVVDERLHVRGLGGAAADEVEVVEHRLARIGEARPALQVVASGPQATRGESGAAAEQAVLLEHENGEAGCRRRERRTKAADPGAGYYDVVLGLRLHHSAVAPTLRTSSLYLRVSSRISRATSSGESGVA